MAVGTGIRFSLKSQEAKMPQYMTEGSAGADIFSQDRHMVMPGETRTIYTGVLVAMNGIDSLEVRPRSSLSTQGLLVHHGTIDPDYCGELMVTVSCLSENPVVIDEGARFAQLVLSPARILGCLPVFLRGREGGFGSTGK